MNKLTAEKCRERIKKFKRLKKQFGIAMETELSLQAFEIALPVLEQQEKGEMDFIRMQELLKNNQTDTYWQIENDGWIEWKGGRCPVSANDNVEIKLRDGGSCEGPGAHILNWANRGFQSDIIAYRVIENDGREG
ncbi:hypothetical protein ACOMDP_11880 [Pantoea dispersa]|uniref:hypothetical protein n=1 Tax=Pantoea dispersa TaxID=59814 RepID=UPI003B80FC44